MPISWWAGPISLTQGKAGSAPVFFHMMLPSARQSAGARMRYASPLMWRASSMMLTVWNRAVSAGGWECRRGTRASAMSARFRVEMDDTGATAFLSIAGGGVLAENAD